MHWLLLLLEFHLFLFSVILVIATGIEGYKYLRFLLKGPK